MTTTTRIPPWELMHPPTDKTTPEELAERMKTYVRTRPGTTFAELHHINGDEQGDWLIPLSDEYPHVVLWAGVTPLFLDAYHIAKKDWEIAASDPLIYMFDGSGLKMPTIKAKNIRKTMKRDRWLPVVFHPKS